MFIDILLHLTCVSDACGVKLARNFWLKVMNLQTLFAGLSGVNFKSLDTDGIAITSITTDPALCKPGALYLAAECETVDSNRLGVRLDGRQLIPQALARGAAAVLLDNPDFVPADAACTIIQHDEPLSIMGILCSRLAGPPYPEQVALVTGTNGKTSTVTFCRLLWAASGRPACSVGNLGGVVSDGRMIWDRDPVLSVPDTVKLHDMLHQCATTGVQYVAMEATSHALFDHRLTGVKATIGAFTNLTRDHLDFHGTMDEYFRVKMTMFTSVLPKGSTAVLNADSPWFEAARKIAGDNGHRVIDFGKNGSALRIVKSTPLADGQLLDLLIFGESYQCKFHLFGEFQVSNLLCSLAIVLASGLPVADTVKLVESIEPVEGRLELVAETTGGGKVIVDYAHSPDGIRAALEACRTFTIANLIIVFGCNGERDSGKRYEMGEIAAKLADRVIVTDGHPRSEDPANIRRDVLSGAPNAVEIASREEAIATAIECLQAGDTLLIAGLGHEKFRTIGDVRVPYSDAQTAKRLVANLDLIARG